MTTPNHNQPTNQVNANVSAITDEEFAPQRARLHDVFLQLGPVIPPADRQRLFEFWRTNSFTDLLGHPCPAPCMFITQDYHQWSLEHGDGFPYTLHQGGLFNFDADFITNHPPAIILDALVYLMAEALTYANESYSPDPDQQKTQVREILLRWRAVADASRDKIEINSDARLQTTTTATS
jgi:hypothetical protein